MTCEIILVQFVCPKIILREYFFYENLLDEVKANYGSPFGSTCVWGEDWDKNLSFNTNVLNLLPLFLLPSLPSRVLMSCQLLTPVVEVGGRDHRPMMRMWTPVPNLLLLSNPGPLRLIYPIAMTTPWKLTTKVLHIYNWTTVFFVYISCSHQDKNLRLSWDHSSSSFYATYSFSPVYTRPLTRIRIRIKLIRVRVNALIRIAIRVT